MLLEHLLDALPPNAPVLVIVDAKQIPRTTAMVRLQANRAPEQEETAIRGRAWFECGVVNDLQGRREQATECYQRALEYPDDDDPAHAYHARARQYLETPYTYEARFRFLSS